MLVNVWAIFSCQQLVQCCSALLFIIKTRGQQPFSVLRCPPRRVVTDSSSRHLHGMAVCLPRCVVVPRLHYVFIPFLLEIFGLICFTFIRMLNIFVSRRNSERAKFFGAVCFKLFLMRLLMQLSSILLFSFYFPVIMRNREF